MSAEFKLLDGPNHGMVVTLNTTPDGFPYQNYIDTCETDRPIVQSYNDFNSHPVEINFKIHRYFREVLQQRDGKLSIFYRYVG